MRRWLMVSIFVIGFLIGVLIDGLLLSPRTTSDSGDINQTRAQTIPAPANSTKTAPLTK